MGGPVAERGLHRSWAILGGNAGISAGRLLTLSPDGSPLTVGAAVAGSEARSLRCPGWTNHPR
jgi:hypothetical protein